jgi:hypothetical protein
METLEIRLQKRTHASLYALIFLTSILGVSVLLESCQGKREVKLEPTPKNIALQNKAL